MRNRAAERLLVSLAAMTAVAVPACGDGGGATRANGDATAATSSSTSATTGDLEAFCAEARGLKDEGPTVAGDEARRMVADRFTAMAKVAPEAIRGDVETIAAMWQDAERNDITPSIGGPDAAESIKPYSELMERHPDVRAAGTRFSAFVGEKCGFFY